jgi:hypothetical protein
MQAFCESSNCRLTKSVRTRNDLALAPLPSSDGLERPSRLQPYLNRSVEELLIRPDLILLRCEQMPSRDGGFLDPDVFSRCRLIVQSERAT